MNNEFQHATFPLTVFGGDVSEMASTDLPAGAASRLQDTDFTLSAVGTRAGIFSIFNFPGLSVTVNASAFANSCTASEPNETPWFNTTSVPEVLLNSSLPTIDDMITQKFSFSFTNTTGDSFTLPQPVTIGDQLALVFEVSQGTGSPDTFEDNLGNTYNLFSYHPGGGDSHGMTCYQTTSIASGSCTITFTLPGSRNVLVHGVEVTNAGTMILTDPVNNAGFSGVWDSEPITVTGSNLLLTFDVGYAPPVVITNDFTTLESGTLAGSPTVQVDTAAAVVGSGTYQSSFSQATEFGEWITVIVAFPFTGTASGSPVSCYLQATNFPLNLPPTQPITGMSVQVNGFEVPITEGFTPSTAVFQISLIKGNDQILGCSSLHSPLYTFQLQQTASNWTVGSPNDTWGLGAKLTATYLNDPTFGFNIQAFAPDGTPMEFEVTSVVLTVYAGPNPPANFNYIKTMPNPDGTHLTLALDNNGTFWKEAVESQAGALTAFYTAIEPGSYAKSVTANYREYIALSDLFTGTDMPRQYDGTYLDRVSQTAPGAPPVCSSTTSGISIVNITQNPPINIPTGSHDFIEISSGTNNGVAGNIFSFIPNTAFGRPGYLNIGDSIFVSGLPTINNFRVNNDPTGAAAPAFYTISAIGPVGTGESSYWVSFVVPFTTYYNQMTPAGVTVEATKATLTATSQVPNLEVSGQFSVSGNTEAAYNSTWTVAATPNASQLQIGATQLTSNVATYSYNVITGSNPLPGQFVTVTATDNGNGIFNVVNTVITSATSSTFSVNITSPNIASAAEEGTGVINGTQFVFDPLKIVGTGTGGQIVTAGVIASGPRQCVVLFQTRNGGITPASVPVSFDVNVGASNIGVAQIPTGPSDVTARILAFTPAGAEGVAGGFFYYIPQPVTVIDNGQSVTYSATLINDNTTTQVTLSFPDSVLLASTEIDIQGQNYFQCIELGSSLGVINYSNRLFWWGEDNKVQNFINMSFDGGTGTVNASQNPGQQSQTYPLGWTIDPSDVYDGTVQASPLFGGEYYVKNTSGSTQATIGMITQNAFKDYYGVPIIAPNTTYSVRFAARSPNGSPTGNFYVDLYRPSTNTVLGNFQIALSSLTANADIFSGPLLTVPISDPTTGSSTPPPPPPPPAPPVYSSDLLQSAMGTTTGNVFNDHRDNTLMVTLPNPVTQGSTIIAFYTSFHYCSPGVKNQLTVTDNNNNLWQVAQFAQASGSEFCKYVLIAQNAVGGTTTLHFDEGFNSHSNSHMCAVVSEWSGVLTPYSLDGSAQNESSFVSTITTGSITTTFAHDLVFTDVSSVAPAPTGFTIIGTAQSATGSVGTGILTAAYKQVSSTGTFNPSWTGLSSLGSSTGITCAFRLTPVNQSATVPSGTNTTAVTPSDLLLRIYGVNVPNNGDFAIDRVEVFPTQQPVLVNQFRASYVNAFDEYDGLTGNTGPNQDNKEIAGAAVLFDNLYCLKKGGGIYSTADNGQTEPNLWSWSTVSNTIGTVGVNSYDYGEDWLVTADRPGLFVYGGGPVIKISQEMQPVWNLIQNWEATVVRVDLINRRIFVLACVPTPNVYMPEFPVNANPQTPNVVLMCNFREVDTIQALASAKPVHQTFSGSIKAFDFSRKWSYWNIQTPYLDFCFRMDGSEQLLICNGVANSKIYQLDSTGTVWDDDGLPINSYYTTFGFPQVEGQEALQLGMYQLEVYYAALTVVGEGTLFVNEYPDNPLTPFPNFMEPLQLDLIPALGDLELPINDIGSRFFIRFGTNCAGDHFTLSKVALTVGKSPWAPVKGVGF